MVTMYYKHVGVEGFLKIGIFETRVVIIISSLLPLRSTFLAAVVSWPLLTPKNHN
jgi:hypothetical protein